METIDLVANINKADPSSTYSVSPARPNDGEIIEEIATLVNINNYAQFDRGFLFYSLTSSEYNERIERGDLVYIFSRNDIPIGFITAVHSREIRKRIKSGTWIYTNFSKATEEYSKQLGLNEYIAIDQTAIIPEMQNRGYGERFLKSFCKLQPSVYFADLLEEPLTNPRISYWMKRGFKRIGEIEEVPPKRFLKLESSASQFSKLKWGIYFVDSKDFACRDNSQ